MKKKILIGVAAVVVLLLAAAFYLNYRNNSLSPAGVADLTSGDLTVSVTYGRPSVRDRLIFGEQSQNALQPYGKYWRLGANWATEITFNKDVSFNGVPVKEGTYRMFAFPGPDSFEIGLNTELDKWGYNEPDYGKDILRTKVPTEKITSVEQHTISLQPIQGEQNAINVVAEWADIRFAIPVKGQ